MVETIIKLNRRLDPKIAKIYADSIYQYSVAFNIDPKLVAAVIAVESRFKADAKGPLGEVGLMQLRPKFHMVSIPDPKERIPYFLDAATNIAIGVRYLSNIKSVFEPLYGDFRFLEHYNRGPNCKPKTFAYTERVLKYYVQFGGEIGEQQVKTTSGKRGNNTRRNSIPREAHFSGKTRFAQN